MLKINVLADVYTQPWFIILMLVLFFGLVVIAIILIKKYVINRNVKKEPIDEDKVRKEELNRVLEPMTDEKSIEQMKNYEEKDKPEGNSKEEKK
jgi:cytochrome c biogenesis protein ResB